MPTLLGSDADAIRGAAQLLRAGRVVGYPTDTLYGLAVDPRNAAAVRRLFDLKGRPESSALTLIACDMTQAEQAAQLTPLAARLAQRWWPGPLTIVVTARAELTREALAGGTTVGIRVPDHAVARALALEHGFPMTATSANRSGASPAVTAAELLTALPEVDGVVDGGRARGGAPSTIVRVDDERVTLVRAGAVAWERVLESVQ
jgi:L-threonylcarbamoyladenylate synthase